MTKKYLLLNLILVLLITCHTKVISQVHDIKKSEWLVGSWRGIASDQPFYEAWRKADKTELTQYGIQISGKDTTISVIGKITLDDGKLKYGDERNQWKASELTDRKLVLVNAGINFPSTIVWEKLPNGHWYCLLKNDSQKVEYDIERFPAIDKVVDRWISKNKKS